MICNDDIRVSNSTTLFIDLQRKIFKEKHSNSVFVPQKIDRFVEKKVQKKRNEKNTVKKKNRKNISCM